MDNDLLKRADAWLARQADIDRKLGKAEVDVEQGLIRDLRDALRAVPVQPAAPKGEHPEVSEAIKGREHALEIAARYGGTDGDHHKAWVIDQMCRAMLVNEKDYAQFIAAVKHGDDGPDTYSWDEGIAP